MVVDSHKFNFHFKKHFSGQILIVENSKDALNQVSLHVFGQYKKKNCCHYVKRAVQTEEDVLIAFLLSDFYFADIFPRQLNRESVWFTEDRDPTRERMSDADLTGRSEFQTELAKARYLRSSFSSIRFWPFCIFPEFKVTPLPKSCIVINLVNYLITMVAT